MNILYENAFLMRYGMNSKRFAVTIVAFVASLLLGEIANARDAPRRYIGVPTPPDIATFSHETFSSTQLYDYDDDQVGKVRYRVGPNGPYTHFIDPRHKNSRDAENPNGTHHTPRKTMPRQFGERLAPGSVVEIHGTMTTSATITVSGTKEQPIIFRGVKGDEPTHQALGGFMIEGNYIIFENIKFDWNDGTNSRFRVDRKDIVSGTPIHDFCIRHCEFFNGLDSPVSSFQCIRAKNDVDTNSIYNIVIWNNRFHDMGVRRTTVVKGDVIGVSFDANVRDAWVLENRFERVAGDAMQVACDSYVEGRTSIPQYIYFAGNVCNDAYENIVDLKLCKDIVISQNEAFHIGEGYGNIGGPTAVAFRYGTGAGPENVRRSNIWTLYNSLHDSNIQNGGFNSYASAHGSRPDFTYFIGNTVYNCGSANGKGYAFFSEKSKSVYWLNNVAWNVPAGFHVLGNRTDLDEFGFTKVVNNIVGVSPYSKSPYGITIGGTPSAFERYTIKNNIWYNAKFRSVLFSPRAHWRTLPSFSRFCSAFPRFCQNSTTTNPMFSSLEKDLFSIQGKSPGRDNGSDLEFLMAAAIFEERYPTAMSFRRFLPNGKRRIAGPRIDIGVDEFSHRIGETEKDARRKR